MKTLKSILGYLWAAPAVLIVLAAFAGNDYFSSQLAAATDIKVNPHFTGGEIVKTIDHGAYRTNLHRPVFDGLFGERSSGFIQIDWSPAAGMPEKVQEAVDYNNDGREDFRVVLDTEEGSASVTAYSPGVGASPETYKLKNGWAVRVPLHRSSR
jgi:hypothetical protein